MVWKIKNIGIINYNSYYLHETWYPNDVNVNSKNNVIIVFNKLNFLITFPFKKFIFSLLWSPPPLLTFFLFLAFLYPSPYGPFSGTPFPPLNKGEEMKLWSNNRFAKVLIKSSNFCKRQLMKHFHDQLKWLEMKFALSKMSSYFGYKIDRSKNFNGNRAHDWQNCFNKSLQILELMMQMKIVIRLHVYLFLRQLFQNLILALTAFLKKSWKAPTKSLFVLTLTLFRVIELEPRLPLKKSGNHDVISFFKKSFILRRPGVAIFADIIKIETMFIKDSRKVNRIRNYLYKWNLSLYFLI